MTHLKLIAATLALALAYLAGSTVQAHIDEHAVTVAHQNEMQANGLEDECKTVLDQTRRIQQIPNAQPVAVEQ